MCLQMMCEEGSDFFLNRMSYTGGGEKVTLSHCLIVQLTVLIIL